MKNIVSNIISASAIAAIILVSTGAHGDWFSKGKELLRDLGGSVGGSSALGADEIAAGLKEALQVGTERVVAQLGTLDGFNGDPAIRIPLPESLDTVRTTLARVGMSSTMDDLEVRLNRAAEAATPKAKSLFLDAIKQMTLDDAKRIYQGPDDAATRYFQSKMSQPLAQEMTPIVDQSLSEVGAVKAYDDVMGRYDSIPFVPDVKADLTKHVVERGTDGIFYYLAQEEAAIRKDPVKRTTALLKKVFGSK